MTYRQMQKRMRFRHREIHSWKIRDTDVPLISAELDGAVITAYREGYLLVEIDGRSTAFSAFFSPAVSHAADLNLRLSMKAYLDLDWRLWPLIYGSYRIQREQQKKQMEREVPISDCDWKRNEDRKGPEAPDDTWRRQMEEDLIDRDAVRALRETILSGMCDRWQETARLRYFEGESRRTVAEELGTSLAVMRAMEYRMRRHIRKKLEETA